MRNRIIIVLGAVVISAILIQLSTSGRHHTDSTMADTRYHRTISEWVNDPAIGYIVIGQVISKGESRIIPDSVTPPEIQARIEQNGGLAGSIVTDYTFRVAVVLKGNDLKSGDTITIVQGGGNVNGYAQEIDASRAPIEVEEQAVLSLVYDPRDPTVSADQRKYAVITQPEVRYRVLNGKIELMPGEWQDLPDLKGFVQLKGMRQEEFVQKMVTLTQATP